MSRLYDRLKTYGTTLSADHSEKVPWNVVEATIFGDIGGDTIVVKADNVADYWITHHAGGFVEALELPSIAPPWERFFIEYSFDVKKLPPTDFLGYLLGEKSRLEASARLPTRIGALCIGSQVQEGNDIDPMVVRKMSNWRGDWQQVRFTLSVFLFFEYVKGQIRGPVYHFVLLLNEQGQVAADEEGKPRYMIDPFLVSKEDSGDELTAMEEDSGFLLTTMGALGAWVLSPVRIALAFMHCKNVVLANNVPSKKLESKHRKRHGRGLCTYKTLEIEAFSRRGSGGGGTGGIAQRSLHITRGHFRTYRVGSRPFGRDPISEPQTWWIESHVRGSKARGEVVKDYSVRAPR